MKHQPSRFARVIHSFSFRLMALTALAGLVPVCVLIAFSNFFAERFENDIGNTIQDEQRHQWQRSSVILGQMAEDFMRYKALDVALQLDLYLRAHPSMTVADLQNDPAFREIAIQPVGRSGYSVLIDTTSGFSLLHRNRDLENRDPRTAQECPKDCWQIIEASLGGRYASGLYSWREEDGRLAKKYMYIAPLRETTGDRVRFAVVATTYFEEFTRSIDAAKEVSAGSSRMLQAAIEQQLLLLKSQSVWFLGGAILVVLLIAAAIGRYFSRVIGQLRQATAKVNRGDYDIHLPTLATGEIGALLAEFKTMAASLESATVRREQLERIVAERIAEAGKLEEKLRQAQKMEAIGALAGGVAHDLNNTLSSMVTLPELLLLDLPEDSRLRRPLTLMHRSGLQAAAIVEDLLTMARRGVSVIEVLDLKEIVGQQLESPEFRDLEQRRPGVRLVAKLPEGLLHVRGSRPHLAKAVAGLLNNAIEAMPTGGEIVLACANTTLVAAHSGYELIPPGDYVTLSVSDQGPGLGQEDLPHLFEPFYTKKKMGRTGTGLAMAIVWGTVKDHEGYIDVNSVPGEPCRLTIYLPATTEATASPEEFLPVARYQGQGQLVLVVDDSDNQRAIAEQSLVRLNYRVASVDSGEAALRYLRENPVDLVVLDMIMPPGIDGLETYQRLAAGGLHPPLVIASGFSENDRVRALQALSGGVYLRKPYTLQQLGLALCQALAAAQTTHDDSQQG